MAPSKNKLWRTLIPLHVKNGFNGSVKQMRDAECEWQAEILFAGFQRIDRLSRNFQKCANCP